MLKERMIRWSGPAALALVLVVLISGQATKPAPTVHEKLRAKAFMLIGPDGSMRGNWTVATGGKLASLNVWGPGNQWDTYAGMTAGPKTAGISVVNGRGRHGAVLAMPAPDEGNPTLTFSDRALTPEASPRLTIGMLPDGTPGLSLHDKGRIAVLTMIAGKPVWLPEMAQAKKPTPTVYDEVRAKNFILLGPNGGVRGLWTTDAPDNATRLVVYGPGKYNNASLKAGRDDVSIQVTNARGQGGWLGVLEGSAPALTFSDGLLAPRGGLRFFAGMNPDGSSELVLWDRKGRKATLSVADGKPVWATGTRKPATPAP